MQSHGGYELSSGHPSVSHGGGLPSLILETHGPPAPPDRLLTWWVVLS